MKNSIKILFYISITTLFYSCCKPATCISFSKDELNWIPYKEGDSITFKSNLTGRRYKFTAEKPSEHMRSTHNCLEENDVCKKYFDLHLKSSDTLGVYCQLENTNNGYDKNNIVYNVWFKINDVSVFGNGSKSILETKIINGITYSNVIEIPYQYNSNYIIYYAKNFGLVAFYNLLKNEWLYKQ